MTQVYLEQDGTCYLVNCKGHAAGSSEVCAAVSCLVYTLAGWLQNADDTEILHDTFKDGDVSIRFRGGYAAQTVFDLMTIGFLQLQAQYGDYISVDLKII